MKNVCFLFFIIIAIGCQDNQKTPNNHFKTGTFKTVLKDNESISIAFRNSKIQIETYDNKKDTFNIEWVNNFEYILVKKKPKTLLDSTPFHVKITAVKKESYQFSAYYKNSKFKQKGTAYKIDQP